MIDLSNEPAVYEKEIHYNEDRHVTQNENIIENQGKHFDKYDGSNDDEKGADENEKGADENEEKFSYGYEEKICNEKKGR